MFQLNERRETVESFSLEFISKEILHFWEWQKNVVALQNFIVLRKPYIVPTYIYVFVPIVQWQILSRLSQKKSKWNKEKAKKERGKKWQFTNWGKNKVGGNN